MILKLLDHIKVEHIVKILNVEPVARNVKRFILEKPVGYSFVAGQATDISINQPGLTEELRPFTFTCTNDKEYLEFIIKIYKGHEGITEKLSVLTTGDELIIHDVFGTIHFIGPGVFIAGGAGITPFIAILRQLKLDGALAGNTLLFANYAEEDIILRAELKYMLGDQYVDILKTPTKPGAIGAVINLDLLRNYSTQKNAYYYVCGPDPFILAVLEMLETLNIDKAFIVLEAY
ncbi:FAD-binding oxidoreductase [Pedobacter gandavensis]|uniref:FAD-binding oxidoreductase n=1 Tax=Pedobacter gandavensis TaxID=2679963 RepID=UPI00292ECC03|nr:FAD-binding oxidoreductase [Pedobacter gandavensis]